MNKYINRMYMCYKHCHIRFIHINKSKLNLITVIAVIATFAGSMIVAGTVYAQSNSGSDSSSSGGGSSDNNNLKNSGSSSNGNSGLSGSGGAGGSK